MDFKAFKRESNTSSLDRLQKEVEKINTGGTKYMREENNNYWRPTVDKAGNALAVIRFLPGPAVDGDGALPWVSYWDHGFQDPVTGKWYIERSRTSIGDTDPVSEFNNVLWGDQANRDPNYRKEERDQARRQKRRFHYVSNIYVVKDEKNPEAEGKVFLYKYGKKIFDKITKMMHPDLETEPSVNPFDLWTGANFKLKQKKQGGYPNFEESSFQTPGPLNTSDEELEKIWKSEYSLAEIVDHKHYKSYDELKSRLNNVLGIGATEAPFGSTMARTAPIESPKDDSDAEVPWNNTDSADDMDDDLKLLQKLAEDMDD